MVQTGKRLTFVIEPPEVAPKIYLSKDFQANLGNQKFFTKTSQPSVDFHKPPVFHKSFGKLETLKETYEKRFNTTVNSTDFSKPKLPEKLPTHAFPITNYFPSSNKPTGISERLYHHYVIEYTLYTFQKMGYPKKEILLYALLLYGEAGDNLMFLAHSKNAKFKIGDCRNLLPLLKEEDICNLPLECLNSLKNAKSIRNFMPVLEIPIVRIMNEYFQNDSLQYTNEKKFSGYSTYYNNTPNVTPDYIITLYKPIYPNITLKAMDLKMISHTRFWHQDIIQSSTSNLGLRTVNAQRHLKKQIRTRIISVNNMSAEDQVIGKEFSKNLDDNYDFYLKTNNVNQFVKNFNSFHENYNEYLCKYKIGMNLQVEFSENLFNLEFALGKTMRRFYQNTCELSDSPVNVYLRSCNYHEGTTSQEHQQFFDTFCNMFCFNFD